MTSETINIIMLFWGICSLFIYSLYFEEQEGMEAHDVFAVVFAPIMMLWFSYDILTGNYKP